MANPAVFDAQSTAMAQGLKRFLHPPECCLAVPPTSQKLKRLEDDLWRCVLRIAAEPVEEITAGARWW
jgi:hypothetical protein